MNDIYIPKLKSEIHDWLSTRFPGDKWQFSRMKKKQLYAIYFMVRKNRGEI